jgi:hypothetical protein
MEAGTPQIPPCSQKMREKENIPIHGRNKQGQASASCEGPGIILGFDSHRQYVAKGMAVFQ